MTRPGGAVDYTVYRDADREVRFYPAWDATTSRPTGPTVVAREDAQGRYAKTLAPSAGWAFAGGTWAQAGGALAQTGTAPAGVTRATRTGAWPADQEVEARVRVDAWEPGGYAKAGVGVRTDPATGEGYSLVFRDGGVQFHDDYVAWGNAYPFAWAVGTWYRVKLRAVGSTLQGKVWADGTPEPAGWMFTQAGWAGRAGGAPALNGGSAWPGLGAATAPFDDVRASAVVPARPTGGEAVSGVQSLSRTVVNAAGQSVAQHNYFDLAGLSYASAIELGTAGVHYRGPSSGSARRAD